MPPQTWQVHSESGRLAPGARLLTCVAVIAAAWLWALPKIAKTPSVRQMIDRNEALGIDPSAKFYSELPLMPQVLERLARHSERSEESGVALDSSLRSE